MAPVGNEEHFRVKIVNEHLNLGIDENELEIHPVDNLNMRKSPFIDVGTK